MFIAELGSENFDDYDLTTLRTGIMAGSPCPVEVMKRVILDMHVDQVTIAYGMTETSLVSTQTRSGDDIDRKVSTVGRVHPHVEVKIADPVTGEAVEAGGKRRATHSRLLGDGRILERSRPYQRGDRR